MPRATERDPAVRFRLAQAIVYRLEQDGHVSNPAYRTVLESDWREVATKWLAPPSYWQENRRRLYEASFHRNLQKVLRLEHWPDGSTLDTFEDLSIERGAGTGCSEAKYLRAYREYLTHALTAPQPVWRWIERRSFIETPGQQRIQVPRITDPDGVRRFLDESADLVRGDLGLSDSQRHSMIFESYLTELEAIRYALESEVDERGADYFIQAIQAASFEAEKNILKASLTASSPHTVSFSDSGWADQGAKLGVWYREEPRREIVRTLSLHMSRTPELVCRRIIFLDTLRPEAYSPEQMLELSKDVAYLVQAGIDVTIGSRRVAQDVGDSLFNYAVIDDGTLMKASDGHTTWSLAKVPVGHRKHRDLVQRYADMQHPFSGDPISFNARRLRSQERWRRLAGSARTLTLRAKIIRAQLSEAMSSIPDAEHRAMDTPGA